MAEWDMRPDETSLNYAMFRAYLQLGANRNMHQAAKAINGSNLMAIKWCTQFEWVKRVKAWEQFLMDTFVSQTTGVMKQNGEQIISDMLNDYNDMLVMIRMKQKETMDRMLENPDNVSFDELTKLANARRTVDDLGRRASALPSSFKASDDKPTQQTPKAPMVIGWVNPPKKLTSGDEEDV